MISTEERPARILHLSDLHFGMQFQTDKWQALKNKSRELAPDLVVVTGDLVNTPWFWMLKRARAGLRDLHTHLNPPAPAAEPETADSSATSPCDVWVIPGNHDTRITGLVPVQWLLGIAGTALGLAALCFAMIYLTPPLPAWAHHIVAGVAFGLLAIAGIALVLRLLVRSDLRLAWGAEHFLTAPRCSSRVPVGIVPFDSASEGVSWARGRISKKGVSGFRAEMAESARVTWIAAVHHHPLPLPYDHKAEPMMAMDNAGALLSELAQAGIRLVLHGHKHHQHFARIVINPAESQFSEVAVLSAGTPTNSSDPGAFWHGFNLITVHADGRVKISMFEAPPGGGAFRERDAVDLAPEEEQDRRRHLADRNELKIRCERMLCIADIDAYGDARFYREFREVRTEQHAVDRLAGPYIAGTSSGFVETYRAQSISTWGPQISLQLLEPRTLGKVPAAIRFASPGLQRDVPPIDFVLEFYANNCFALNRWQYECMYPPCEVHECNESIRFSVPRDIAVRELTLHVRFPNEMPLPTRIDVRQKTEIGDRVHSRALPPQSLVRIDTQRIVQVRIPYPRLESVFEISWEPHGNTYPIDGTPEEIDIRRAVALRRGFGRLHADDVSDKLKALLQDLELEARDVLGVGERQQQDAYDVAIYVFDSQEKVVRYLAGSYEENDPRRSGRYGFGLGLPGRAFKSGAVAAFRRPAYSPSERPWGYVFPDGRPVTDPAEVPEAVILAIPAAPPNALDWPYAVVQISTDNAGLLLKTANTPSDTSVERFCAAVRGLTEDFEALF
jgi:3',5'-cyclic AMP phosphodiesterase CpdA